MRRNKITRCLRSIREEFNRNSKCHLFLSGPHHQRKFKVFLVKRRHQELEEARLSKLIMMRKCKDHRLQIIMLLQSIKPRRFGLQSGLIIHPNMAQATYSLISQLESFSMIQPKQLQNRLDLNFITTREKPLLQTKNRTSCLNIAFQVSPRSCKRK